MAIERGTPNSWLSTPTYEQAICPTQQTPLESDSSIRNCAIRFQFQRGSANEMSFTAHARRRPISASDIYKQHGGCGAYRFTTVSISEKLLAYTYVLYAQVDKGVA